MLTQDPANSIEDVLRVTRREAQLIERDPDVTRLIDKLEERGLMQRRRDARDRRVYRNAITPAGLELLASLGSERGTAIVLVTHEPRFASFADRVVSMRDGQIVDIAVAPRIDDDHVLSTTR